MLLVTVKRGGIVWCDFVLEVKYCMLFFKWYFCKEITYTIIAAKVVVWPWVSFDWLEFWPIVFELSFTYVLGTQDHSIKCVMFKMVAYNFKEI